jgi:predicted TIM-barrel fold metal-dependent hydrolase
VPHAPVNGRSPADPCFDPFWARVQDLGIKLVFHIGYEGFTHYYGTVWGEPHRFVHEYSALQHYLCFGERPVVDAIAVLILQNFFGRFPGIDLISIENGSVWVGPLLKSLDKAARMGRNGPWLGGPLSDLPSDIFRNHVYVNPFHEDDIVGLVDAIGADRVLFGSDYPHPEGLAQPLEYADMLVDNVSPTAFENIMVRNGRKLLGLDQH